MTGEGWRRDTQVQEHLETDPPQLVVTQDERKLLNTVLEAALKNKALTLRGVDVLAPNLDDGGELLCGRFQERQAQQIALANFIEGTQQ